MITELPSGPYQGEGIIWAEEVNGYEISIASAEINEGLLSFSINPYQIKAFRLILKEIETFPDQQYIPVPIEGDYRISSTNIQDMTELTGSWDQYAIHHCGHIKRDVIACYSSYTHDVTGDHVCDRDCLFFYEVPVEDGESVLTLPSDNQDIGCSRNRLQRRQLSNAFRFAFI